MRLPCYAGVVCEQVFEILAVLWRFIAIYCKISPLKRRTHTKAHVENILINSAITYWWT